MTFNKRVSHNSFIEYINLFLNGLCLESGNNFFNIEKYLYLRMTGRNMPRGRPVGSQVRQNVIEILHFGKKLHGYGIYLTYRKLFPKVTMRAIYYHLKKGVVLGELRVAEIRKEKGNYSWGGEVERIYYELGEKARPSGNQHVADYFKGLHEGRKRSQE